MNKAIAADENTWLHYVLRTDIFLGYTSGVASLLEQSFNFRILPLHLTVALHLGDRDSNPSRPIRDRDSSGNVHSYSDQG